MSLIQPPSTSVPFITQASLVQFALKSTKAQQPSPIFDSQTTSA